MRESKHIKKVEEAKSEEIGGAGNATSVLYNTRDRTMDVLMKNLLLQIA